MSLYVRLMLHVVMINYVWWLPSNAGKRGNLGNLIFDIRTPPTMQTSMTTMMLNMFVPGTQFSPRIDQGTAQVKNSSNTMIVNNKVIHLQ